jgi:hypothetical protein
MTLPPLPLPPLPPLVVTMRRARVLAAEDIPGYYEYRQWVKAQQQLSDEGVLMQYPVGHARLAAVEARRIANLSLPFIPQLPLLTVPLLPPPLPRLPR